MLFRSSTFVFAFCLVLTGVFAGPASGADASCRPVTGSLVSPGTYCLQHDHTAAGIEIDANDVVLDLGTRCLLQGGGAGASVGIHVRAGRQRIVVRNGCISGFVYGMRSDPGSSHITVRDVVFRMNTFRGAHLESDHVIFEKNVIDGVRATVDGDDIYPMGFDLRGDFCRIAFNWVLEVYPSGSGDSVGIAYRGTKRQCEIVNNVVRNSHVPRWGRAYGISAASASLVEGNVAVGQTYSYVLNSDARVLGNLSEKEQCSQENPECPDNIERALAGFDKTDRHAAFRVARSYHRMKDYAKSAIYYLIAARLGSTDAARIVERHFNAGYLSSEQKAEAERISARILDGVR